MKCNERDIVHAKVQKEKQQHQETRRLLFEQIEESIGLPLVAYFTSFRYPVMIDNNDAEMLEQVFRATDLSKGLALMISSPGGDGLASERIINLCRGYSETSQFTAIVPGKAKSAATMICMGAHEIWMGIGSELGPIDPQVTIYDERGGGKVVSAHNIVKSYEDLFSRAVQEEMHLEPYLQQLQRYDEREISEYKTMLELAPSIVIKYLKTDVMINLSDVDILEKLHDFTDPNITKNHGRPIYRDAAQKCGLKVKFAEEVDAWDKIYELYVRLNMYVNSEVCKCVESKDDSFVVGNVE